MGSHQEWLASIGRRTTRERQATSNMESATMATLAVMVPIGIGATHGIAAMVLPMLVAIVISGAVVVMNPVHIAGALIMANPAEPRRDFSR